VASSEEPVPEETQGHSEGSRPARLDAEARRVQIIDAAWALLESDGVAAMAIDEVAEAAGVSRSLVYTYFGDRDSLVAEVYLRVLERIDDELSPQLPHGMPVSRQAAVERTRALLQFAADHPAAWRLLVTDSVRRHPTVAAARAVRVARVTDGIDGGGPPLVADATFGLLESGVLHWVDERELPLEAAAELLTTTLWSGLTQIRAEKRPEIPRDHEIAGRQGVPTAGPVATTVERMATPPPYEIDDDTTYVATIATDRGDIVMELDPQLAPTTVNNFVALARKGYYDGLAFHRVVPEFVIQGGCPEGTGRGGPGYNFADEPVKGDYTHGAVAMANAGPDTNGSQFFICIDDCTSKLDKAYNLFGHVTEGLELADAVQAGERMNSVTISEK
jgi:cyclophilin family peptidyl-prolyl cis-trans isomerase/AcrR family transcriptional regulator